MYLDCVILISQKQFICSKTINTYAVNAVIRLTDKPNHMMNRMILGVSNVKIK